MRRYYRETKSQGQVLLIGLMLIALITTIVGTGALRSVVSNQTTKNAEESKKASNIAKGALEAGTNDEPVAPANFTDVNPNVFNVAPVPQTTGNTFVYDKTVEKDQQYLLYLADYDYATNTFNTNYYPGNIQIHYADDTATCPILEILEVNDANIIVNRTYTNTIGGSCPNNPLQVFGAVNPGSGQTLSWNLNSITFNKSITISNNPNIKLLVIRPFFAGTKLGFVGTADATTNPLNPQGREVSSTVRTIDGAQKTEKVYQAYPQIPLSLFATIF